MAEGLKDAVKEEKGEFVWGTGRRKSSVARVRVRRGTGNITVNGRDVDSYFPNDRIRTMARAPLVETNTTSKYDVVATVGGGGFSGQAGALMLGVARALVKADSMLEEKLREVRFLTRDSRMKERKKIGRRGARAGKQYSKR